MAQDEYRESPDPRRVDASPGSPYDMSGGEPYDVSATRVPVGRDYDRKLHDASQTSGTVSAGNNEVVTITSPSGTVWLLQSLRAKVASDGDATSGVHRIDLVNSSDQSLNYFRAESNHNTDVHINFSSFFSADSVKLPSTDAALSQVLTNLVIDDTEGVQFLYKNGTDAAQENSREYQIDVLEVTTA